jgi:hypothetical protein
MGGNPGPYSQEYLQTLMKRHQEELARNNNPYQLHLLQARKPPDIYIAGQRFDGQTGAKK